MTSPPGAPARILLTSAGSLVGRCLMDVLRGRREDLLMVGGDLVPSGTTARECDVTIQLPPTGAPEFTAEVEAACREFDIDLVIPCRDPDTRVLAAANDDPQSPIRMASPRAELVEMTRDKWLTHQWCIARGIPFSPSVCTDESTESEFEQLVDEWGYPLIAKPRDGSGSLGVRVLTSPEHLEVSREQPGYIMQPFIDPPAPDVLDLPLSAGVPLFWEVPVIATPAVTIVIGPDGRSMDQMCFLTDHRLGRVEALERVRDQAFAAFAEQMGRAFQAAGWRGPLSMPLRRGPDGWYIIELNPRFSGGTSGRLLLGFDEVRWVVNRWLDRDAIPEWTGRPVDRVERHLRTSRCNDGRDQPMKAPPLTSTVAPVM